MNKRMKQKYGKRYNEEQIYDLCDYLARDILNGLRAFEKHRVGVPACFCGEDGNRSLEEAENEWHKVLRKMIWSFEQYVRDYPDEPFKKGYDLHSDEQKAYYSLVEEGRHLFAKYFDNLWI